MPSLTSTASTHACPGVRSSAPHGKSLGEGRKLFPCSFLGHFGPGRGLVPTFLAPFFYARSGPNFNQNYSLTAQASQGDSMKIWIRNKSRLDSRCQINGAGSNFLTYWLAPLFLVLMVALGQAWGVENTVYQWPPGAPTTDPLSALGQSWPGTWTPVTSLNDPNDGNAATLEFVGDALNPGFYIARTSDYLFFRIRMNYSGVVSTTVDILVLFQKSAFANSVTRQIAL